MEDEGGQTLNRADRSTEQPLNEVHLFPFVV